MAGNKKYKIKRLFPALVIAALPILCAVVRCALDGQTLSAVFLPASEWNDELFYYKMTEDVLWCGFPRGYFGFNESHGLLLSFAAWSPLLLVYWLIWGGLFGWNYVAPIYCNLFLLGIGLFLFVWFARPTVKQTVCLGAMYAAFLPATRFALSVLPEAQIMAMMLVYLGLLTASMKTYKRSYTVGMFVMVALLTWMRPYLILLVLAPIVLWVREKGKKAILYSVLILGGILIVYWAINHYFSASYFVDLFYTDWLKVYFEQGFKAGLVATLKRLKDSLAAVALLIKNNLLQSTGLQAASGLYYLIYILEMAVLLADLIRNSVRKETADILPELQMLLAMIGFFGADLLMYRITEGGRHTFVFTMGCIALFSLMGGRERGRNRKWDSVPMIPAVFVVLFVLLFVGRGNIPLEFGIPYKTAQQEEELASLSKQLEIGLKTTDDKPSFANTIVWTLDDTVGDAAVMTDFGAFYAVPKGYGINLCTGEWLQENMDTMESRYVGTVPGGRVAELCNEHGYTVIAKSENLIVYQRY